jgi:hypothetical protein
MGRAVSSVDGIVNSGGAWSPTSTSPRAPGQSHRVDLSKIFARAFHRNLDTIFERARPTVDSDADASGHTLGRALPEAATFLAAIDQRRNIVGQRLATSVTRLGEVAAKLDAEYPLADVLQPASTGTWDPATFQPRSEGEARAFAQRMAIDMTEAAARLDVVKNELDAARLDAQATPNAASQAKVKELTQSASRQMQYLAKLSSIVDNASEGSVADMGADALSGETLRSTTSDVSTRELAHEMRAMGFDQREVERMLGAGEVSVEEQRTPGGSERLRRIDAKMGQKMCVEFLLHMWDESARARREDDRAREKRQQTRDDFAKHREDEAKQHERELDAKRAAEIEQQQAALRSYLQHRARLGQR